MKDSMVKTSALRLLPVVDLLICPLVFPSAWLLRNVRRAGVHRLPQCRNALMKVGVFPIRNHYYEPQFDHRAARQLPSQDRSLPGIDWNIQQQLQLLAELTFSSELSELPTHKPGTVDFYINNGSFQAGDAEYWYQVIRRFKPRRIIEIGSGNSTLMAIKAIQKNREQDSGYTCKHACIEPYEMPWLEETGVTVIRRNVEDLGLELFAELGVNDILFIDSSHIIRPRGDVLFEYLELLPTLNKGVIVHVHDIFSPRDYLRPWLVDEVRFWNEQYLLEAFLSHNRSWKILGALNYLQHNYYDNLKSVAPFITQASEPGSFYMQKIS